MKKFLFAALFTLLASPLLAQTVNPNFIAWDHDDHAITTRYEIGYFLGVAASPVQTANIPVAATTAVGTSWETPLPRPVLGSFTAKMRACGAAVPSGEVCSDWSGPSGPFSLTPKVPANMRAILR